MDRTSLRSLLLLVTAVFLLCACTKEVSPDSSGHASKVRSIKTMVTGIDQFDGGQVWGLNTSLGSFVVGPEVPGGVKSTLYEHLMEARDRVITIFYEDIPASKGVMAHKRVTGITVQETEYRFDY